MKFKARAKNPGRCAYGPCANGGDKIYIGQGFKYLACSKAHAALAEAEVLALTTTQRAILWPRITQQ